MHTNIAISGEIGTGKSTLARNLSKKLGWDYINLGDFFRKWHRENNVPLENTQDIPPDLDRKIDMDFQKQMAEVTNTIFEARLAGWLAKDLPSVFKVLVTCDPEVASKRSAGRDKTPLAQIIELNKKRAEGHQEKFKRLYGVDDYLDPKYFDFVLDTTNISPKKAVEKVLAKLHSS